MAKSIFKVTYEEVIKDLSSHPVKKRFVELDELKVSSEKLDSKAKDYIVDQLPKIFDEMENSFGSRNKGVKPLYEIKKLATEKKYDYQVKFSNNTLIAYRIMINMTDKKISKLTFGKKATIKKEI